MDLLLRARWLLPAQGPPREGGALRVRDGRIAELLDRHEARAASGEAGARQLDLGDAVLAPGLVNAHAHLELSGLHDLPRGGDFGAWIGEVLSRRAALEDTGYREAVERGARRLLSTGTTTVGDVDGTGAAEAVLGGLPLRARVLRELLDGGDPTRTPGQLARLEEEFHATGRVLPGLSPHGPHTAGEELLVATARRARAGGWPVQVHWAETEAEVRWLRGDGGPLAARLGEPPRCTGLELLERCGLLGPRTSLVHANHPDPGELERVAVSGATLVHCPGTHAWFERGPAPLATWRAHGARVALGTDSRASNEDLDLRLEMARVRAAEPGLAPREVLGWATLGGARALALEEEIGDLTVGKRADLAAFEAEGVAGAEELLDRLTAGMPAVRGVWVDGEEVGLVPRDLPG
jgi:cytosine/adenosine deaminase-related metal-dependent hydrolase